MERKTNIRNVIKFTDDNWHGNYEIEEYQTIKNVKLVEVSLLYLIPPNSEKPDMWRVCVWGNDDFGLELDGEDYEKARDLFLKVLNMEKVNKEPLNQLGFERVY